MTVFNPGTGGTIKSTTYETAFLEILVRAANATRLTDAPETAAIAYTITQATKSLQGTFVIPFTSGLAAGLMTQNPTPFVDESGYTSGTGGDLASTGLIDNLIELSYRVNELPGKPDYVFGGLDLSIDMDAKLISGSFILPVDFSINSDGSVKLSAVDFLA